MSDRRAAQRRKLRQLLHLRDGDSILSAYAQPAIGRGWANHPLWVIVRQRDCKLRHECLQPEDQPEIALILYDIAALVHGRLLGALRRATQ